MSSLHDKLYNYEQVPPGKTWEKIAAALDESHLSDKFPSKLYSAEATVPVATWENIAKSLDEKAPVAIPAKSFSFFRYVAAAVIIGIVAFGVIKLVQPKNERSKQDVALSKQLDTSSKKQAPVAADDKLPVANTKKSEENIIPRENKNLIASTETVRTVTSGKTKKKYSVPANDSYTNPVYAYNELSSTNIADRYVMLMTPNGIVRMSKKLGDLVCCVSGQEQDEDCKDQLKKWQEKIACSPVTQSPGNFMDILSLVSSLNNKEL